MPTPLTLPGDSLTVWGIMGVEVLIGVSIEAAGHLSSCSATDSPMLGVCVCVCLQCVCVVVGISMKCGLALCFIERVCHVCVYGCGQGAFWMAADVTAICYL